MGPYSKSRSWALFSSIQISLGLQATKQKNHTLSLVLSRSYGAPEMRGIELVFQTPQDITRFGLMVPEGKSLNCFAAAAEFPLLILHPGYLSLPGRLKTLTRL